jgi:hypothetical protein
MIVALYAKWRARCPPNFPDTWRGKFLLHRKDSMHVVIECMDVVFRRDVQRQKIRVFNVHPVKKEWTKEIA